MRMRLEAAAVNGGGVVAIVELVKSSFHKCHAGKKEGGGLVSAFI